MTNRQDRRFAAKMARQATKRGKTPAERALFSAAAAFAAEEPIEIDFALEGLDAAWVRLEPELDGVLDGAYAEFRREVYSQAAWAGMATEGTEGAFDLQPILFPATGAVAEIARFAADPARLAALARSLRESGVFPEEAAVAMLPVVLAASATDLLSVGPAAVSRLTAGLADMIESPDVEGAAAALLADAALPSVGASAQGEVACLLLGVCLTPVENWDRPDDEVEALQLAMAATRASWLDTFAADLPFRLDEPVFWHEAGSSLAWHAVAGRIEAEIARQGLEGRVARIDACLMPETGDSVLVARVGEAHLGPFHAPRDLVFTDIDGFAGLAERYGGELVEHERPSAVTRLVDGGGQRGRRPA